MIKLPVLGKVAGFILIVLPMTDQERKIRLESLKAVRDKIVELGLDKMAIGDKPRASINTMIQPEGGLAEEEQEGYDIRYDIGVNVRMTFCHNRECENSVGWQHSYVCLPPTLCSTCRRQEAEDSEIDVDVVYDRQAHDEEY